MRTALIAVLMSTAACSNGPCAPRVGTYQWQLKARSGDCGDFRESIFTAKDPQPTAPPPPCSGTITYSADNCDVTHDTVCPIAEDGSNREGMIEARGVIQWNAEASAATGVLEYEIPGVCQGTYDATYQKL